MQSQFTVNCLFTDHEQLKMSITNHKELKMAITCHENKYIYPTISLFQNRDVPITLRYLSSIGIVVIPNKHLIIYDLISFSI